MDEGYDVDAPDDAPGWVLLETEDPESDVTGRDVGGLHESLQTLDPSGRDGSYLWE